MAACFCTGKCRTLGYCPINPPKDIPLGHTHVIPTFQLTEERVREIIKEELDRRTATLDRLETTLTELVERLTNVDP